MDEHGNRGERLERLERLAAELESAERVLREALDFIGDDQHLTDRGIAEREELLADLEAIERGVEAVRQEHRVD